jgi:hypothetical protein
LVAVLKIMTDWQWPGTVAVHEHRLLPGGKMTFKTSTVQK